MIIKTTKEVPRLSFPGTTSDKEMERAMREHDSVKWVRLDNLLIELRSIIHADELEKLIELLEREE